jgi:hypothetical protein
MKKKYPSIAAHYSKNWAPFATNWAEWGRTDVLDKNCHTNNLLERFMGLLKYKFLNRKTQSSLTELAQLLMDKVAPWVADRRCFQLAGRASSTLGVRNEQRETVIQKIVDEGAVYRPAAGADIGVAVVAIGNTRCNAALGDLSCSCGYSGISLCTWLGQCKH